MTCFRQSLAIALACVALASCSETPTDPETGREPASLEANALAAGRLAFAQVSAGVSHTCGVTTGGRLYCWGRNVNGQVGDGTTTNRSKPVPVGGALRFRAVVNLGGNHSCAIRTDDRLYCWGLNESGQLGDGTTIQRTSPVLVAGGLKFRSVTGGWAHTCGISSADNRVYCWGDNGSGQLGIGTTDVRLVPAAVGGTLRFRHVSAGYLHTCGLTTEDRAYCWGSNSTGQIGDSTKVTGRLTPVTVRTNLKFRQIDAGNYFNCAVTATGNRAFCWGNGINGELGNGVIQDSFWPKLVSGGLALVRVSAGIGHACGETAGNKAYCWGYNGYGQVGDGTTGLRRPTPVAVKGGLSFIQVSAGWHTCGVTPASVAYCWGSNSSGELGDGTTARRLTPRAVVGP